MRGLRDRPREAPGKLSFGRAHRTRARRTGRKGRGGRRRPHGRGPSLRPPPRPVLCLRGLRPGRLHLLPDLFQNEHRPRRVFGRLPGAPGERREESRPEAAPEGRLGLGRPPRAGGVRPHRDPAGRDAGPRDGPGPGPRSRGTPLRATGARAGRVVGRWDRRSRRCDEPRPNGVGSM